MTQAPPDHAGLLPYTVATWIFSLHVAGVRAADAEVAAACDAVLAAQDRVEGDQAGEALVARTAALLADGEADVACAARQMFGDRVSTDLGQGDRAERTHRIRKYQFARGLPWLARIWERIDGAVRPGWLVVERVTDEVTAMDPNPWNDIDETRHVPVADFHVLWELDACTNVYLQ